MNRIITIAALLVLGFSTSFAQPMKWKKLADGLLTPARNYLGAPAEYGAIEGKDTTILAGWGNLHLSTNAGATWTKLPLPILSGDYINDIAMYDDHTFAVICPSGTYYSSDRGNTWMRIRTQSTSSILFANSPTTLVVSGLTAIEHITILGNIQTTVLLDYITDLHVGADRAMYALGSRSRDNTMYRSVDDGLTWSLYFPSISSQGDCLSMICDEDDAQRFLIVNEDWAFEIDDNADVFLSSDGGSTWRNTLSQSRGSFAYLSGNASQGCHDYFIGTIPNGVLRSTDKGVTWATIGGPPIAIDSRLLYAFDDSTIYAVDTFGSVWVTDPLQSSSGTPSITTGGVFRSMSLPLCDTAATDNIIFHASNACQSTAAIDSVLITGKDSLDYVFERSLILPTIAPDTVRIRFTPSHVGNTDAKLKVVYSNGAIRYVDLSTTVNPPATLSFTNVSNITISTDTLGGDITIPIQLKRSLTVNAGFLLHYDTTHVEYKGTFDTLGVDHTKENIPGRVRIGFNASIDTLLYAKFSTFPIDSNCSVVTIDSLTSIDTSACFVTQNTVFTATICGPAGCGIGTLSRFIRYGTTPEFSITPNPTRGTITLRSNMDIDGASIDICNQVGVISYTTRSDIKKADGLSLDVSSLASGAYILLIKGHGAGVPLVIMK